nr:cell surface A33 antigen-like isoform X4 [Chrysemys picta bellii]
MRARLERLSLLWALLLSPWLGAAENTAAVFGVNQTPPSIRAMEGSEFTIECTFNSSNNSIKWFVEWNKTRNYVTEKLSNGTDRIRLSGDKEKRSPSLTVKKADVTDSGTYVCWVGNKDGTSRGNGTQVTIDDKRSNASHIVFIIRMVLGALVIISAVMIVAECMISEKRAAVNLTT